jgi:hypothetical protein
MYQLCPEIVLINSIHLFCYRPSSTLVITTCVWGGGTYSGRIQVAVSNSCYSSRCPPPSEAQ